MASLRDRIVSIINAEIDKQLRPLDSIQIQRVKNTSIPPNGTVTEVIVDPTNTVNQSQLKVRLTDGTIQTVTASGHRQFSKGDPIVVFGTRGY